LTHLTPSHCGMLAWKCSEFTLHDSQSLYYKCNTILLRTSIEIFLLVSIVPLTVCCSQSVSHGGGKGWPVQGKRGFDREAEGRQARKASRKRNVKQSTTGEEQSLPVTPSPSLTTTMPSVVRNMN
jgi:hypothetical protein